MAEPDYYALLQVVPDADPEMIKAAYKVQARKYHPDTAGPQASNDNMKRLNEANDVLSDPVRRKEYDERRRRGAEKGASRSGGKGTYAEANQKRKEAEQRARAEAERKQRETEKEVQREAERRERAEEERRRPVWQQMGMEFIKIPGGEFLMGSAGDRGASANEKPQHRVYLSDYWIAKTPVTNAQYKRFVEATGHQAPSHWKKANIPRGKEYHPW